MTPQEMYESTVKLWPANQRFLLAQLILKDISPLAVVDYSEEWSDEDLQDLTKAGMERMLRFSDGDDE